MLSRNINRQESSLVCDEISDQSLTQLSCRICLKEGEIPIFGQEDKSEDIMEFGGIKISDDDDFPQHLCFTCLSLLESAMLFRKTAKQSDDILKSIDYLEESSVISADQDYIPESRNDTDNETFIKREYLEYKDTSESETELTMKCESKAELKDASKIKSETDALMSTCQKEIEMQLLKVEVKDEADNADVDNELVMIIVSHEDKPDNSSLKCLKCDITFENSDELEQHETKSHPATPPYHKKCDICHEIIHKNNYKVHIKQHRNKYQEKHCKKYGKVECEVCGKRINKSYHKYHMRIHGTAEEQAGRFVDCTVCEKPISSHYFSDHMKRVHDKTLKPRKTSETDEKESKIQILIKCPICDKNVKEDIYKEHLAKHGGSTKRYICDQCGKEFRHPSAFKTHTLTHGSELKYQCQFCPYRGLHLGLLKVHVRTHTGDYNYKCPECPARFITKSNLSKHFERHRGLCKFKCETCNKGFYSKRDVDKHIKTVHLDLKNNICDICGKGFGHRDNMLSHQLKVHKREKITDRVGRMPSYLKEEHKKK